MKYRSSNKTPLKYCIRNHPKTPKGKSPPPTQRSLLTCQRCWTACPQWAPAYHPTATQRPPVQTRTVFGFPPGAALQSSSQLPADPQSAVAMRDQSQCTKPPPGPAGPSSALSPGSSHPGPDAQGHWPWKCRRTGMQLSARGGPGWQRSGTCVTQGCSWLNDPGHSPRRAGSGRAAGTYAQWPLLGGASQPLSCPGTCYPPVLSAVKIPTAEGRTHGPCATAGCLHRCPQPSGRLRHWVLRSSGGKDHR